jgi:hypothetical protein
VSRWSARRTGYQLRTARIALLVGIGLVVPVVPLVPSVDVVAGRTLVRAVLAGFALMTWVVSAVFRFGPPRTPTYPYVPNSFKVISTAGFFAPLALLLGVPYLLGQRWLVDHYVLVGGLLAAVYYSACFEYAERRWPEPGQDPGGTGATGVGGRT